MSLNESINPLRKPGEYEQKQTELTAGNKLVDDEHSHWASKGLIKVQLPEMV